MNNDINKICDRLLTGAGRVEVKLAALAAAEAEVARCKQELKEGRASLLAAVKQHYVDSDEKLRRLNVQQFQALFKKNLETGVAFDDLVDALDQAQGE